MASREEKGAGRAVHQNAVTWKLSSAKAGKGEGGHGGGKERKIGCEAKGGE